MTSRRVLFLLGLGAAVALGLLLRLSTREQVTSGARVRALTSDDYYHLRRARFAVAHYPWTIVFDPLMNFPQGGVPIWPPLFDVALATPSRILHGAHAQPETVEREAAWVPLLFAAGSIVFAGLIGRVLAAEAAGVVLALFVAVAPGHLLWTQFAHTDQHVAESFFGLLVLLLFLRCRDRLSRRDSRVAADLFLSLRERVGMKGELSAAAREASTGVALALAVLTWQGAIYWGAIIALSLFLEALLTKRSVLRPTVLILGLSALLVAPATAAWLGPFRPPFTYISFGFFQPLFLAALAGGTILLETGLRALRGQLSRRETAARLAAMTAAGVAILPFAGGLLLGLARGVGYVVGKTSEVGGSAGYVSYPKNWLKGIFEARPLLADGLELAWKQLSAAFFLAPLVILLWATRAVRGARPATHITLALWGAVTLLQTLAQRLNVYYAAPLAGLCLIEASKLCVKRFGRTPPVRAAVAVLVGLLLALPMAPGIREEISAVRVPGSDLFSTLDWMRRELPHEIDVYDARLLNPSPDPAGLARASSVLAPWSLGHLVLYEAELPVLANNFGYGFLESIRFFLSESEEEALAIAKRHRVRWVVATDLVLRLNDYASYLDRPPYLRMTEQGLAPTPRYFSTVQARLYDFDAKGERLPGLTVEPLPHFRLRFHSKSAIGRGGRWLARWKVFEIVD